VHAGAIEAEYEDYRGQKKEATHLATAFRL